MYSSINKQFSYNKQKDFELLIKTSHDWEPTCILEKDNNLNSFVALVNFIPQMPLQKEGCQQFIFLIDCSEAQSEADFGLSKQCVIWFLNNLPQRKFEFDVIWYDSKLYPTFGTLRLGNAVR